MKHGRLIAFLGAAIMIAALGFRHWEKVEGALLCLGLLLLNLGFMFGAGRNKS